MTAGLCYGREITRGQVNQKKEEGAGMEGLEGKTHTDQGRQAHRQ